MTPDVEPWLDSDITGIENVIKFVEERKYDQLIQLLKNVLFLKKEDFPYMIFVQDVHKYIANEGKTEEFLYKIDNLMAVFGYVFSYGMKANPGFKLILTFQNDLDKVNLDTDMNFLIYRVIYKYISGPDDRIITWNKEGKIRIIKRCIFCYIWGKYEKNFGQT